MRISDWSSDVCSSDLMWLGQFEEDPFGRRRTYLGVERFWDVFQSDTFQSSLWVTVKFTLMTVPLGLALGLGLAIMAPQQLRGIPFFRTIFTSTLPLSVAVAPPIWLTLFNPLLVEANNSLQPHGGNP